MKLSRLTSRSISDSAIWFTKTGSSTGFSNLRMKSYQDMLISGSDSVLISDTLWVVVVVSGILFSYPSITSRVCLLTRPLMVRSSFKIGNPLCLVSYKS